MKYLTLICAGLLLGGCSSLRQLAIDNDAPEKVADAFDKYCVEIPYDERVKNRTLLNDATDVATVRVDCDGDPAP